MKCEGVRGKIDNEILANYGKCPMEKMSLSLKGDNSSLAIIFLCVYLDVLLQVKRSPSYLNLKLNGSGVDALLYSQA